MQNIAMDLYVEYAYQFVLLAKGEVQRIETKGYLTHKNQTRLWWWTFGPF